MPVLVFGACFFLAGEPTSFTVLAEQQCQVVLCAIAALMSPLVPEVNYICLRSALELTTV